jgi:hypothetical protein
MAHIISLTSAHWASYWDATPPLTLKDFDSGKHGTKLGGVLFYHYLFFECGNYDRTNMDDLAAYRAMIARYVARLSANAAIRRGQPRVTMGELVEGFMEKSGGRCAVLHPGFLTVTRVT